MYSALFSLAMKYGSKILIGLAAFLLLLGLYFHWKNSIFDEGYNKATAEWTKREAEINRQQTELLKLRQHEYDVALQKNTERYTGALKHYVEQTETNNKRLADNLNKRVFVRAKCPQGNRNPVPSAPEVSSGNTKGRGAVDEPELGTEDARALFGTIADVNRMALVCRQALDFINENGMVK